MWRPVRLASIALLLAAAVVAQQPASLPAFDVASVQPFIPPTGGWAWGKPDMDPQHFRMPGAPLRYIVSTAYGLDDYQLTGLPDWAAQEFFSITAGTDAPTPPDQMLLMLRRLLADRFQLRVEDSVKDQRVWALVAAPDGPKLKPRDPSQACP